MARTLLLAAIAVAATAVLAAPSADAGQRREAAAGDIAHPKSRVYRGGPRVKGFVQRRGGYSYSVPDAINTYGDARSKFGGASSYRDPFLDRQTNAGPFDHGFFFDSGIAPRGGDSPYMN
jgi:hypothetical protein